MISTTLLYITSPRSAWISSYKFMNSWHFHLTLREIFNRFWSGFYPNFLEFFHIVPRWFCQNGQHESYRWCFKFRKHPREQIYHTWAMRFKGLKLAIHLWIASHSKWRTHNKTLMIYCIILCCRLLCLQISS